ncbi:NAD(P)/FAD-dependent oxidoreductase [Clostridiisalibacter paucivorans]|uniref:NAD(P)/FAD-dependent oxidoreductase n=1 Tax=Clostridiisalibacter paucivorans TaxID=408753 RepID=UPI00047D1B9D|nr:NAD(P)/FAD-dependent oxidoreductase [Clostridiisalibacter paucivorans]
MYDVIIIGKGPAGLSSSIYTGRGNLKTLIIGKDSEALEKAYISNFCCAEEQTGKELIHKGIKQALDVGVDIVEEEVLDIKKESEFVITTDTKEYKSKSVIIATGKPKIKIDIPGINKYEAKGVHYCVACDGFFYKDTKVGVIGYNDYAYHEILELESITKDITLFTNGKDIEMKKENLDELKSKDININKKRIGVLEGNDYLEKISFEDGSEEEIDGIFVAYGTASSVDFARKLGITIDNQNILVDDNQQTNIPGIFAAGDCTGGITQVATAVGQGSTAGIRTKTYLQKLKK